MYFEQLVRYYCLQIAVVVGLGASGIDIAREISQVAKEVHIASETERTQAGKD
jgi:hypothetical protein